MADPAVEIERLSHSYGERQALSDLSLSVYRGEIFGFLGPNGSGKTTLFRILSTLMEYRQGRISVFGLDLALHRREVRQGIGVVFQSPSLDKQLTARENLRHQGHLYGLRGADLTRRIDEALGRLSLGDRSGELVGTFSGGMRRRVELAKGLLHRPRLLLLDEPSTGLDPSARIDLWRYLTDIRQAGVTVMLTTHLMDEGDRCDRLAVMHRGKLAACDTPAALKERIGGDVITLAGPDLTALREALRSRLGIEATEVDGTLRIERARGHEFIPQLAEAASGLIDSISLGKPTLEDAFIRLTGHRFESSAAPAMPD